MTKPFEPGTRVVFVGASTSCNARCLGFQGTIVTQVPKPQSPHARRYEGPFYAVDTLAKRAMFPRASTSLLKGVPHQVLRRVDDPPKVETPTTSKEISA